MKELKDSAKIELIAFTACIVVAFLVNAGLAINEHISISNHVFYDNYWINLLFGYIITCVCYFMLFFFVENELRDNPDRPSNAVILICILIDICFFSGLINPYFALLLSVKMFVIYFIVAKQNTKINAATEALILFGFAIFLHSIAAILSLETLILAFFTVLIPVAILHYLYAVYILIPKVSQKKNPVWKLIGYTVVSTAITYAVIVPFVLTFYNHGNDVPEFLLSVNLPLQLLVIPIVSVRVSAARNKKEVEEIKSLKTELGKSDASLNFLKSQINPHFLFNALNTLYGTALQEKAERTGEGIQRLGDMMRFMLEENIQDKIPLSRDIEYLNNYIDLQKLRIATTSDIDIQTQIEETAVPHRIAPMVLLPFVENAFKHGISLNNPSHIKITLQTKDNKLFLDVNNSIHIKNDNDPEKLQSGIGLENVKQRLALLYPDKFDLVIRESAKEFFVHLTLELEEIPSFIE